MKIIVRYFCNVCGEQVYRVSDDDMWHCDKCDKDYPRGDLIMKKEEIPDVPV